MTMKITRRMAMMSHLSDVQEMIYFEGKEEEIRMRVNFVKMLISDTREELTVQELNELWIKCQELYGIPVEGEGGSGASPYQFTWDA